MRIAAVFFLICLALGFALGGSNALGRIFLSLGQNKLAAAVFVDPAWQGIAEFRAGDFNTAAESFSHATLAFNRGNALAQSGAYAAALEAYDLAMAQGHAKARANFDLVSSYYAGLAIDPESLARFPKRETGPEMESFVAEGAGRASGTGTDATNSNTMLGLAELDTRGSLGVRRIFDDKYMLADERWLQQLADVPGAYLQARISHEHKQRVAEGVSPEPADDPE